MAKEQRKEEHSDNYRFFSHQQCEYFPCHKTKHPEDFNCLFCFCPLYVLGPECGGRPVYTDEGIKDCSQCLLPHSRDGYEVIIKRYQDIVKAMKK